MTANGRASSRSCRRSWPVSPIGRAGLASPIGRRRPTSRRNDGQGRAVFTVLSSVLAGLSDRARRSCLSDRAQPSNHSTLSGPRSHGAGGQRRAGIGAGAVKKSSAYAVVVGVCSNTIAREMRRGGIDYDFLYSKGAKAAGAAVESFHSLRAAKSQRRRPTGALLAVLSSVLRPSLRSCAPV